MPLGERGSHRSDHRPETRLPEGEHVSVALDDQRPFFPRDRGARTVEPVEQVALTEQLSLRRVDVLRLERIVLAQAARLETDDAGARVGDREEQSALEVVVAAPIEEPCPCQLLPGEAALAGLAREGGAAGGEAEPVLAADLLGESPGLEVRACFAPACDSQR
jgi:hypothetical protein